MKASTLVKHESMVLVFEDDPADPTPEEDRTLNITVAPGALTPEREQEIDAADENSTEPVVDLLLDMVIEWDLLDDKGKVIPLTKPALMKTPIIVLALILNEITKTLQAQSDDQGKVSAAT